MNAVAAGGETIAAGSLLAGRYRLGALIGFGGSATIYHARDERLGRHVAVKLLHAHLVDSDNSRRRLQNEARAVASLAHPNIVTVFDSGVVDGTVALPYVVMEYVEGAALRDVLSVRGQLDRSEVLGVALPLCEALGAAHEHGIVHRDVKPENVLIRGDGTVKVADFGIARLLTGTRLTSEGVVLGTIHYLAPELVLGEEATPASDQYAVGIMLYELLAGQRPFAGATLQAVAARHLRDRVPAPSTVVSDVSPELDEVVMRATAPDASERFPTMAALAKALRKAVPEHPQVIAVVLDPVLPSTAGDVIRLTPGDGSSTAADVIRLTPGDGSSTAGDLVLLTPGEGSSTAGDDTRFMPGSGSPAVTDAGDRRRRFSPRRPAARGSALGAALLLAVLLVVSLTGALTSDQLGVRNGGHARSAEASEVGTSATTPMPSVVGRSVEQAVALLAGAPHHLSVRVDREPSAAVPLGEVQAQHPQPGTAVATGAEVVINVSTGPPSATPDGSPAGEPPAEGPPAADPAPPGSPAGVVSSTGSQDAPGSKGVPGSDAAQGSDGSPASDPDPDTDPGSGSGGEEPSPSPSPSPSASPASPAPGPPAFVPGPPPHAGNGKGNGGLGDSGG